MSKQDAHVIDSRMEDVERASNMIPFNLSLGKRLLAAPLHGSSPVVPLNRADIGELQGDLGDYVSTLDCRLRGLFSESNGSLAKSLKENERAPALLSYFQLQQKMMVLTDDLSTRREKDMLSQLASLIVN